MTEFEHIPLALRTWTGAIPDTALGMRYLKLGLMSELGELAGVLKRIIQDQTPLAKAQSDFESKLGDVIWYTTAFQEERNYSPATNRPKGISPSAGELKSLLSIATSLGLDTNYNVMARARAQNIAKLASRAKRGVIQGSGGDR